MSDRAQFGTIMAVDRANGVVRALLDPYDETTEEVVVPYNPRRMPWPLARAVFRESPRGIRCVGPLGHRRVLFHDDFTHVDSGSPVAGDSVRTDSGSWRVAASAGSLAVAQDGVDVAGGLRLESSGFANAQVWMGRDTDAVVLGSGEAFLFSTRFSYEFPGAEPTKWFPGVCLETTGAEPDTPGLFASSVNSAFRVQGTETAAAVIDGTVPAESTVVDVDFIYDGVNVSGWVNGNGPSTTTTDDAGAFTPHIGFCTVGGQLTATFDWVTCSVVPATNIPDL